MDRFGWMLAGYGTICKNAKQRKESSTPRKHGNIADHFQRESIWQKKEKSTEIEAMFAEKGLS